MDVKAAVSVLTPRQDENKSIHNLMRLGIALKTFRICINGSY